MKKLISLLMIVLFSVIAYSTQASAEDSFPKGRTAAAGDEPNGDGQPVEEVNQAGVTVLGAGKQQAKTCIGCQTAGKILLSSSTRRASPGVRQQTGVGGNEGSSNSSDPVGTGN